MCRFSLISEDSTTMYVAFVCKGKNFQVRIATGQREHRVRYISGWTEGEPISCRRYHHRERLDSFKLEVQAPRHSRVHQVGLTPCRDWTSLPSLGSVTTTTSSQLLPNRHKISPWALPAWVAACRTWLRPGPRLSSVPITHVAWVRCPVLLCTYPDRPEPRDCVVRHASIRLNSTKVSPVCNATLAHHSCPINSIIRTPSTTKSFNQPTNIYKNHFQHSNNRASRRKCHRGIRNTSIELEKKKKKKKAVLNVKYDDSVWGP